MNNTVSTHPRLSIDLRPIKAVLFDLDDTLWPVVPVMLRAEQLFYDWLCVHAPAVSHAYTIASLRQRRVALSVTNPLFHINLSALRHAGLTEAFNAVGEDVSKIDGAMAVFAQARHAVTLFDDVEPVLSRLKPHWLLGSVSNGFADLETIGLAQHFSVSLAAHSFGCAKPDPRIFLAACSALGVQPHETVYVGDDPLLDVTGASAAGLRSVWINRFERVLPPGIVADAECNSLHALETWLHHQARTVTAHQQTGAT